MRSDLHETAEQPDLLTSAPVLIFQLSRYADFPQNNRLQNFMAEPVSE
jgi:hypothetical protein